MFVASLGVTRNYLVVSRAPPLAVPTPLSPKVIGGYKKLFGGLAGTATCCANTLIPKSVVDKGFRAPRGGAPRTLNNYLCLNWKFSGAFEFVALIFGHWDYKPLDAVLL